jgi:hypothetical protein
MKPSKRANTVIALARLATEVRRIIELLIRAGLLDSENLRSFLDAITWS